MTRPRRSRPSDLRVFEISGSGTAGTGTTFCLTGRDTGGLSELYGWIETVVSGLNLPDDLLHAMHIAVEEAAANVAMHGFPAGQTGKVSIRFQSSREAAVLTLEDDGRPFDPTCAAPLAPPASPEDTAPGGLGLILMRRFCSDIAYEHVSGRNRLTLRFPLAAA